MKIYHYLKRDRRLIESLIMLTIASLLLALTMMVALDFGQVAFL